jgi:hypothetical protein
MQSNNGVLNYMYINIRSLHKILDVITSYVIQYLPVMLTVKYMRNGFF